MHACIHAARARPGPAGIDYQLHHAMPAGHHAILDYYYVWEWSENGVLEHTPPD